MAPLLIIGPTYLDIVSRSRLERGRAAQGEIDVSLGGIAYAVAFAATHTATPCRFLPIMRASPFVEIVQESLEEKGAEVTPIADDCLSLGGFCAHLGESGNLVTAVSARVTPAAGIDAVLLDKYMLGAGAVVADFAMGGVVLRHVLRRANAAGVPVFLIGTYGEEKLGELSRDDPPDAVLMMRNGLRRLTKSIGGQADPLWEMAERLGTTLLVLDVAADHISVISASDVVHTPLRELKPQTKRADFFPARFMLHLVAAMQSAPYFDVAVPRAVMSLAAEDAKGSPAPMRIESIEDTVDRMYRAARTDALTGALNRHAIGKALRSRMLRGFASRGELALLLADIDHFKSINDTYGHPAGDAVILWVSQRLRNLLRDCDLVGRWGGEEFVGILAAASEREATEVAERIRRDIEEASRHDTRLPRPITISVGLAQAEPGEDLRESLLTRADQALYQAKRAGRNRVVMATERRLRTESRRA